MSTYKRPTKHPNNNKFYVATHIDDYYGSHKYGIQFPDGLVVPEESTEDIKTMTRVFKPETAEWDTHKTIEQWSEIDSIIVLDPDGFDRTDPYLYERAFTREEWDKGLMSSTTQRKAKQDVSRETQEDGKEIITTKHEDGRQDVEIKVSRLDLKDPTPEDLEAEKKIIDAMSKKIVRVVVIHKPTNHSVNFDSPLPLVRKRAEEVVRVYNERLAEKLGVAGAEAPKSEFIVVEFDAGQVRVSSL